MSYKYTYPVVNRALRNFLVFVLVLLAVVTIAAAIGTVSGIDTDIKAQTMGVGGFPDDVLDKTPDVADEHLPGYSIDPPEEEPVPEE